MEAELTAYLAWAACLPDDELRAEIALLEAQEALAAENLAEITWTLEMFRGFSAAPPPSGAD